MEETYTLTCKFKDTKNKTRSIMINNPTEDLSDDKIKNCILLELISVALVDNHYTENEKSIISKVVEEFNISNQKFQEIFDWVVNLKEMYSKIVELVEI